MSSASSFGHESSTSAGTVVGGETEVVVCEGGGR